MESQQSDPVSKLNDKQRLFVYLYCQYRNASRAAREAGYSEVRSDQAGYQLLRNSEVLAAISHVMAQMAMSKGECLGRMTSFGRGTIDYFMTDEGEITLSSEDAKNNRDLIRKVRQRKIVRTTPAGDKIEETQIEIELHDAKDAVDKLLQIHSRIKVNIDLSSLTDEQVDDLLNKALTKLD